VDWIERMFGKRGNEGFGRAGGPSAPPPATPCGAERLAHLRCLPSRSASRRASGRYPPPPAAPPQSASAPPATEELYYDTKSQVFSALIDTIDLSQLAKLDTESAREEIRDIVNDIITIKNFAMSISEQEELLDDICNDVLGYGPLEPLLARDDIADIMVNGAGQTFIEVGGKTIESDRHPLPRQSAALSICQRIVSQVGRRVDESSPICDARLPDGSRVNVIAPPLAIDGPALTIRKFKKDKLTLDQLVKFGAITPEGATLLQIIGRVRCNIVISGGTGSGKTTLLNCLTNYIDLDERVITCEDTAELQLQQPHVVRLETRPPNIEGEGEITMRDLVKNCLRMRPERIIVGEVRGPEVFDLLQAMNTGHDGSMGTIHANTPRECLSRIESMIAMGGFTLPAKTVREIIAGSIDVIIQAARLRDGSRRITHITEVIGMEGDVIITQDLMRYEIEGEDANGKPDRPAQVDRYRQAAFLGSRPLFQRGQAPGRRARRDGKKLEGLGSRCSESIITVWLSSSSRRRRGGRGCYGCCFPGSRPRRKPQAASTGQIRRNRPGQGQGCARPGAGNVQAPQVRAGFAQGPGKEATGKQPRRSGDA
jgi:pilus assembly protein CpaF